MGIDFRMGRFEAHWSYSGFHAFRAKLAEAIGLDLEEMEGFKGGEKPWRGIKDDLVPFLNHSDSEGILGPSNCVKIARRLRQIVIKWPERDYDREQALQLAAAMDLCASLDVNLEFH